ncbi:hypothetical protein PLICRDRAFT_414103 [Plicaturopsis crispa FD-325 SS-3]|nr:hypothetical protein PLICRDRAFT_414103 [Plicaturopsis crispa FD-325 SS-3]
MNRHHPYGGGVGSYENSAAHQGGSPGGVGPDRSHHFGGSAPYRGKGLGRGRGGGHGSFDHNYSQGAYDAGSPQNDVGPYGNYDAGPPQDQLYQNGGYGGGFAAPFDAASLAPPPPSGNTFNHGYGNHEDGSDTDGRGYSRPMTKPNPRHQRDDKVHDSIIEERIQRERPCRTLFIRNIKYETNSDDVRRQFEEHGEIKTFFDLISTRGMVFVTYFDLRAAERARDRLQGSEISGRPIDVHYSLPRDDQKGGADPQLQGTLTVTLLNSASGQFIDDNEVRHKFQQFGDVKSVRPVGDRPDQRYVEFYDMRACDDSYDRLRHQGLQDGTMDIAFAWDRHASDAGPSGGRQHDKGHDSGRGWEDRGPRGRGGRGRGGRGRGGRGGFEDDWDRRDNARGGDRDRRGRFDDDHEGGRGRGRGGGYNDRFDHMPRFGGNDEGVYGNGGYGGPPGQEGYGGGFTQNTGYGAIPPPQPAQPDNERVEQAKKVQQLLAALKQPQSSSSVPPAGPPAPGPPPPIASSMPPPYPPYPPSQPPGPNPYFSSPPASALHQNQPGYSGPPPNGLPYGQPPRQNQNPQPPGASFGNLPPNILALLQQQTQVPPAQAGHPAGQYAMPPGGSPGMMQAPPPNVPSAPANGGPGYQQLMAFLQSQAGKLQG